MLFTAGQGTVLESGGKECQEGSWRAGSLPRENWMVPGPEKLAGRIQRLLLKRAFGYSENRGKSDDTREEGRDSAL